MGLNFGSISTGTHLLDTSGPWHGHGCRGCGVTLMVRAGYPSAEAARDLLEALGIIDGPPSRVRQMVAAGATEREILAAIPGVTANDVCRERGVLRGTWVS